MTRSALCVTAYRLRITLDRRRSGYLTIVLLVGLLGGLALGAVAGARRTQESFPAFLASTNPSDLVGLSAALNPALGDTPGYDPDLLASLAVLPHVKRVESYVGLNVLQLGPDGAPADPAAAAPGNGRGSVDGFYFDQDRVAVLQGRMADPGRADEYMTDAVEAARLGLHVGDVVPMGVYTNEQFGLPGFGTAAVAPHRRLDATLVGIVAPSRAFVQDDVDALFTLVSGIFTPALTRSALDCCVNYTFTGVQVDQPRDTPGVAASIARAIPAGRGLAAFQDTSLATAQAQRALRPAAVALGVFGGIAALAVLLITSQVIGRQLLLHSDEHAVLRALGADPRMIAADGLTGVVAAVVLGALLAVGVAVGVSPLAPIGPLRAVAPGAGVDVDVPVLGLGLVVLVVSLTAVAAAITVARLPHRHARRARAARTRTSSLARAAGNAGLPPSAVTGIRFALEPGAGRTAVPVRSAIFGAALAMVVVITSLTFGASLEGLVSHPDRYGWNWDEELTAGGGGGDIPERAATDALDHDPDVAAWTGVYFSSLQIDGTAVQVLGSSPGARVRPAVLSGHGLDAPDQVVLGALTLSQLHKQVGDTVEVADGLGASTTLRIVGTATLPATGVAGLPHLEMGTGALLSFELIPERARNIFADPITGPNAIFVRLRPGADRTAALGSLQRTAGLLSNSANFGVSVEGVRRPAEIVNYRTMTSTPTLIGIALGAGAMTALGLTLIASVRRRRRDLALLKTLGFTRGQVAAAVAWQASVATAIGTVIGVPVGIALGRQLWVLFAREIHVLPVPDAPAAPVAFAAVGALVLANVVAVVPAVLAARTPAALVLKAE